MNGQIEMDGWMNRHSVHGSWSTFFIS